MRYAWYMLGVLARRIQKMKGVLTVPAQCAEIFSATHLQIDGEYAGCQTARLEIAADALTLLMPPEYA
jgi:diacylglycerol kinase family enzyme